MPVFCCAASSDGRVFYGGGNKGAFMWQLGGNAAPQQVAGHDQPVSCVEFIEEGPIAGHLCTGSWDGKARFWDLRQPAPVHELAFPGPCLSMSVAGAGIAFTTARALMLFDLRNMSLMAPVVPTLDNVRLGLRCTALAPDLSAAVCGTVDGRVWRTSFGAAPESQFKAHGGQVENGIFEAYPVNQILIKNSTCITASSEGTVAFFNLASNNARYYPKVSGVAAAASAFPAVMPAGGVAALVAEATKSRAATQVTERPPPITAMALNATGEYFAFAAGDDYSMGRSRPASWAPSVTLRRFSEPLA
jgi:WD40 repeat protein